MKNLSKYSTWALLLGAVAIGTVSCTKHDETLNLATVPTPVVLNTDTLNAVRGTPAVSPQGLGAAQWNGVLDAAWNSAPSLTVTATVPSPGNNIFTGFNGNTTNVKMQALYDDNNVYFLFQWNADNANSASSPWYYNPTTRLWAQEKGAPSLNSDGTTYRPAFIQDEFVIAFNISNSCPEFVSQSCYGACHIWSSYGDPTVPEGGGMYTDGPSEYLDVWRARTVQTLNTNQLNDCYIWNDNGELNKNAVANDPQVKSTDGGVSNKQTLKCSNKSSLKVSVPLYVNVNSNSSNGAILASDTGVGSLKVVSVDSNGVLTLINGATIDPRTSASGTAYQQVGMGDGPKCIPGSIVALYTGSRGDVTGNWYWTGSGYKLMISRARKTSDSQYDVDFSYDQPFGIGVMFNGADNEHAIVAGLYLHFKK